MSKYKKAKVEKKDLDELNLYEELVLAAIKKEAHKPRAIVHVCRNKLDQNQVIQILNRLKEKGRVKKISKKSWQAV